MPNIQVIQNVQEDIIIHDIIIMMEHDSPVGNHCIPLFLDMRIMYMRHVS